VALCASTDDSSHSHCRMCRCAIHKGSLRFGEYFWHGNGRNRRYYHDSCVLQRVDVASMPPAQRLRLELQRTKLMQEYSAGRVLLAQRRDVGLLQRLEQLGIQFSKSDQVTLDVLEDICIKLPTTHDQLMKCLYMTSALGQMYGPQILQVIADYQKLDQDRTSNNIVGNCSKVNDNVNDSIKRTFSNASPITTTTMMMDADDVVEHFALAPRHAQSMLAPTPKRLKRAVAVTVTVSEYEATTATAVPDAGAGAGAGAMCMMMD
jgi:hypothetical protein